MPGEILVQFRGAPPAIDFGRIRSEAVPSHPRPLCAYKSVKTSGRAGWVEATDSLGLIGVEPLVSAATVAGRHRTPAEAARSSSLHRLVFSPDNDLEATLAQLRLRSEVAYAEPNWIGALSYAPADPLWLQQSGRLESIGLEEAWQAQFDSTGSVGGHAGVRVAIIDSGIEATHPDLSGAVDLAASYNFVEGNSSVYDDIGHGTRVGGIIGATGGNGEGIAGVAFGCSLLSLDVANPDGQVTVANVVSAINWAVANDADVINLSIRFMFVSQSLKEACAAAEAAGVVVVAAAGNENQGDLPVYPASYPTVIGVGAVLADGVSRAPFSNYNGTEFGLVDLVAPGSEILSTIPGSQYNGSFGSGTSFSAPVVAGVAALLKSTYPSQSGPSLRHRLEITAHPLAVEGLVSGWDGFGLIDAAAALSTPFEPRFRIASVSVDDSKLRSIANNEDGSFDQGETVALTITLSNDGGDASGVSAALSTDSPWVSLSPQSVNWGTLAYGLDVSGIDPFTSVSLAANAPAQAVEFSLTIDWTGATAPQVLTFAIRSEDKRVVVDGTNYFTSTTWTADKTWVVEGQVNAFSNLTVEPGATVRLGEGGRIDILGGKLSAVGTADTPIRFLTTEEAGNRNDLVEGDVVWAKAIQAESWADYPCNTVEGNDVLVLPDGGFVAVGSLAGRVIFGKGEPNEIVPSPLGGSGSFVARFAANGSLVWVRTAGVGYSQYARSVALMPDGGVVVTGQFWTQSLFGAGTPTAVRLNSEGGADVFVARYDPDGNLLWAKGAGASQDDLATAVTTLPDGRIWITGTYYGETATFGKGEPGESTLEGFGDLDVFVASYSPNGSLLWATRAGGTALDHSRYIAVDSTGSAVITGDFRGQAVFGIGEDGERTLVAEDATVPNVYLARFASNGTLNWARRFGNPESGTEMNGYALAIHSDGRIFATGSFSESITFDPGEPDVQTLNYVGGTDIFLAGLSGDGHVLWARTAGGPSNEFPTDVVIGKDDCLYVMGEILGVCTFGRNEDSEVAAGTDAGSRGVSEQFLARYEFDGRFDLVRIMEGIPSSTRWGRSALDVFPDGDMVLCGDYRSSTVIGSGEPNETTITSPWTGTYLARMRSVPHWDRLIIRGDSQGAELSHCVFDGGQVFNYSASTTIRDCRFLRSLGNGLTSTAGTDEVADCDAEMNVRDGMSLGNRPASACIGRGNAWNGIVTLGELSGCQAERNRRDGLVGSSIRLCQSMNNVGSGLVSSGGIVESLATGNRGAGAVTSDAGVAARLPLRPGQVVSEFHPTGVGFQGGDDVTSLTSERNGGFGLDAMGEGLVSGCRIVQNGEGGIRTNGAFVRDCVIKDNDKSGVTGTEASTLERCRLTGNVDAAMTGVATVRECVVDGNGGGVIDATLVETSLISGCAGSGVSGGAIDGCSIVNNAGHGAVSIESIRNSWVVGNAGVGVQGNFAGEVSYSTIAMNGSGGVVDLGTAGLQHSNIENNGVFEAKDTQVRLGSQIKNFEDNYWGSTLASWMESSPFPNDRDPEIIDGFDSSNGWFLDYSPPASGPVADAPDTTPPAFLFSVTPSLDESTNAGPATFLLTFSGPMNTTVNPSVTFHTQAPYTLYVVEKSPGWVNDRAWRGVYAVGNNTGDGIHTLRVSNAVDAHGFLLPDDTTHRFAIEVSGDLPSNNGLSLVLGSGVAADWTENQRPAHALGYNIRRALLFPLSGAPPVYEKINGPIVYSAEYLDRTAKPDMTYSYIVDLVDAGGNSIQWTAPETIDTTGLVTPTQAPWTLVIY